MSEAGKIPEFGAASLRDHGESEQLDRVWSRLKGDIGTGSATPRRAVLWWAPALVVIVFGSGVFVGARWFRAEPVATAPLSAEPAGAVEPGPPPEAPFPAMAEPQHAPDKTRKPRAVVSQVTEPAVEAEEEAPAPPVALPAPAVAPVPSTGGLPEWQRLGNLGEYGAAWRALDLDGGFDFAFARATPEQLLALNDIARWNNQRGRAIQALRRILDQYPGSEFAPIAAFTLGNMLDAAGDRKGANEAFAMYRRLSPKGEFAEDTLARQIDAAIERGDLPLARKLADQYATDFPSGRRLGEIKKQLARLSGNEPGGSASDPASPSDPEEGPSEETADDEPPAAAPPASPGHSR
jgi:hypothetical protein